MDAPGAQRSAPNEAGLIAPGTLVLVVGPSGAGKDTLIAGARAALRNEPEFVFARRVVTRPEGRYEEHDTLSAEGFAMAEAQNGFVLHWQAHGLCYGVPASIADDIRAGRTVIVNTSRKIAGRARTIFAHVHVLLVTAPPEVLNARIAARGRDTAEGSRSDQARAADVEPDATIVNDREAETGIRSIIEFLLAL